MKPIPSLTTARPQGIDGTIHLKKIFSHEPAS